MTLLIVGAHAMDAELMAGALAAKTAREGQHVVLLHLTRGERGHPTTPQNRFGLQLEGEMAAAATALGVGQRWSGMAAPLAPAVEVASIIAGAISELDPAVVVTHWRGSWHPSHQRAHEATLAAVEQSGVGASVLFAENCEDLDRFRVDCFVPIADVYETWLEALDCYELFRRSRPGSINQSDIPYWAYYRAAARVRGLQADLGLATALMRGPGPAPPPEFGLRCR